jgi:two-component system chemotaxis sensor kinase CheA
MNMNMNEYLNLFLEESREHLQNINEGLLKLEQNPQDEETLNEIFRSAHTLKGMAATMGYENIAELTHKMENLLSKLREFEVEFTSEIGDLFFKCVDSLDLMVEKIASGNNEDHDISDLVELLIYYEQQDSSQRNILEQDLEENIDFNEFEEKLITQGLNNNFNFYKITVEIAEDCVMKGVRAFMVFRSLEEIGEIIKSIPSTQEIEDEIFDNEFSVFILSKNSSQEVKELLGNITDVTVKEIISPSLGDIPETNQLEQLATKTDNNTKNKKDNLNHKLSQTVRVDIGKLDNLMNLVGELVINKTRLEQIYKTNDLSALNETVEQIDRITSELQNVVMNVRMVPIDQVFNRFPRMVRDLAKELGKDVNFILEGKETELDRTVIDEIGDPLVHLIRNSLDHGKEHFDQL